MITEKLFQDLRVLVAWASCRMTDCDGVNIDQLAHDLNDARQFMADKGHVALNSHDSFVEALDSIKCRAAVYPEPTFEELQAIVRGMVHDAESAITLARGNPPTP